MRCKAERISEIIRRKFNRDPYNGDVYIFMSKEQKKRMFLKEYLEERERQMQEQKSASSKHPCEGMSIQEIFSFVTFLQQRLEEESARNEDVQKRLDVIMKQLDASQKTNEANAKVLARMINIVDALKEEHDGTNGTIVNEPSDAEVSMPFQEKVLSFA